MAMVRNSLGMLVDMTVPTHVGPYTDFPSPSDVVGGSGGISNNITSQMRTDAMSSFHSNSQIADAFSVNPITVAVPYVYYPGALAQMDTLRRANTYRPRWYCVPDDFNQPLAPYETLEYQIKVTGGSYLWGMRFAQYSGVWAQQPPSNVVLQITEACTGIELFREFTSPQGLAFYTTTTEGRGFALPHLLTQPRLFLEPGDINVELCNLSGAEQYCQLILHFAEPANIVEESQVADRSRRPA